MGVLEIAISTVIAIATTVAAIINVKKHKADNMPFFKVSTTEKKGDYFLVRAHISPGHNITNIRKISSDAEGISLAEGTRTNELQNLTYQDTIDFSLDLPPASLSAKGVSLILSFKLRKLQKSITISLYKSSRIFAARYKLVVR